MDESQSADRRVGFTDSEAEPSPPDAFGLDGDGGAASVQRSAMRGGVVQYLIKLVLVPTFEEKRLL